MLSGEHRLSAAFSDSSPSWYFFNKYMPLISMYPGSHGSYIHLLAYPIFDAFTWSDGAVLLLLWRIGALECLGWVTPPPPLLVGWPPGIIDLRKATSRSSISALPVIGLSKLSKGFNSWWGLDGGVEALVLGLASIVGVPEWG